MSISRNALNQIEHIVVLTLENRSFDNLLGWLYDPANDPPFDVVPADFEGLYGKNLSNIAPDGRIVHVGKSYDARGPQPNPGEPFEDVYSQLFDVARVDFQNMDVSRDPLRTPSMQGFIRNYAVQKHVPADPAKIMESLTPKTVPVLSSLAHHYALCDHWFASIPTQTFCNRSFVHAGTSSGYVNNGGAGRCFVNDTANIFDLLESAGKTWKIFHGGWLIESFTFLTQKPLWKYGPTTHFAHFKEFVGAAGKRGGLPNYSFIEPIYFDSIVWGPENDMHPECNPYEFYGPSNLHRGEELIRTIYDAVRNSPDWESTLLIIVFDEHGGCYDHVPPPSAAECEVAIAPDGKIIPAGEPGGVGFKFDRLGARVPAIIISAYTAPKTRLHQIFEHTSVLSTLVKVFGLPEGKLGARQLKALDVGDALTLLEPRKDRPLIAKPEFSLLGAVEAELNAILPEKLLGAEHNPVSDLRRDALQGAALLTQADDLDLHERIANMESEPEADQLLNELKARLEKSNT
jgi:phospholipase C